MEPQNRKMVIGPKIPNSYIYKYVVKKDYGQIAFDKLEDAIEKARTLEGVCGGITWEPSGRYPNKYTLRRHGPLHMQKADKPELHGGWSMKLEWI